MIQRASGILLPVFSLPGPYGCGTIGRYANAFIDFLAQSGQRYWQILPLVPPGGGNSPYMSPSAFAGNHFFIDPDALLENGWVSAEELKAAEYPDQDRVDYTFLAERRMPLLRKAWSRARPLCAAELSAFCAAEHAWLTPYCAYLSAKSEDDAEGEFHAFLQLLFFKQWAQLLTYAHSKNVKLIGDLPIYVSLDGADVLADPSLFLLEEDGTPSKVAGVPPDAFSTLGQLWGNPLYDWDGNREAVFAWWEKRMAHTARLCDVVRIDHFRGFHTYWSIPATAADARGGRWEIGPGQPLIDRLQRAAPNLEIIAEDLGDLDKDAKAFFASTGLPGMKVLIYAFDPVGTSDYIPFNCQKNSIVYTGTHDAPTFLQWFNEAATKEERQYAIDYLRLTLEEGIVWGAIRGAWSAPSNLAMTTMQDVLSLGADARMNLPGSVIPENWSWRVRQSALNSSVAETLRKLTHLYRRDG